jgi:hypothetical protein
MRPSINRVFGAAIESVPIFLNKQFSASDNSTGSQMLVGNLLHDNQDFSFAAFRLLHHGVLNCAPIKREPGFIHWGGFNLKRLENNLFPGRKTKGKQGVVC